MTTPSPADLYDMATRISQIDKPLVLFDTERAMIAEVLNERARQIEREAYRVKQAAIEAREPRPLHVRSEP